MKLNLFERLYAFGMPTLIFIICLLAVACLVCVLILLVRVIRYGNLKKPIEKNRCEKTNEKANEQESV